MDFIIIIGAILLFFVLIEFGLYLLLGKLSQRFDHILTGKDKFPSLDKNGLEKFFKIGYDPELGWTRKPNTSKREDSFTGKKSYHINSKGSRLNPRYENLKTKIITFGDSFTFCREVDDNETWQHYLSKLQKYNVANFGVGNYGLDQAFLRFKRELPNYKNAKLVIVGIVPETILRNLTVWKHYSEYGNTFGFKPRFALERNKLKLIKNPMDNKDNFLRLKNVLPYVNKYDYFYKDFKENLITFPYTLSILKRARKRIPLIFLYSMTYFFEILKIDWRRLKFIPSGRVKKKISSGINNRIRFYSNKEASELTIAILKEFQKVAKGKKIKILFMMMPQQDDLEYMKETKDIFYKKFIEKVGKFMPYVDLTSKFLQLKEPLSVFPSKTYSKSYKVYGGHYDAKGNKIVAEEINKAIKTYFKNKK